MRYVKYGEEWYKIEETYTDPDALDIYAKINRALDILNNIQSTYSLYGMSDINIVQRRKVHEAMHKLGALLSLPVEVPKLVPDVKTYTVTVYVSGDYENNVPVSSYTTEKEQKEAFNNFISKDNFGILKDISWENDKIIRLFQNKNNMFMSVPVTGKFTFTVGPHLNPDELQEKGFEHFRESNFGNLIHVKIENIVVDKEE